MAQGINETCELRIGTEVLQVQINDGEIQARQGLTQQPDAILQSDMETYLGLLSGNIRLNEAVAQGLIQVEGDPAALGRFLNMCKLAPDHDRG